MPQTCLLFACRAWAGPSVPSRAEMGVGAGMLPRRDTLTTPRRTQQQQKLLLSSLSRPIGPEAQHEAPRAVRAPAPPATPSLR